MANHANKKTWLLGLMWPVILWSTLASAQDIIELGSPYKPSYEKYRVDNLTRENDPSYSGDLSFSIPLLVVPGRHGKSFPIVLTYNSSIGQRQFASWVGLGWGLELGAVERSILGRSDDQKAGLWDGQELADGESTLKRSENVGRLAGGHYALAMEDRDQADFYTLKIDNAGMEILPFPSEIGMRDTVSATTFMPLTYKPWDIGALWREGSKQIEKFVVTKEDGTQYTFGANGAPYNVVDVDSVYDTAEAPNSSYLQSFCFPYRWNITAIAYPDGSITNMYYSNQNTPTTKMIRRYESVPMDRYFTSASTSENVFGLVKKNLLTQTNLVASSYSHPDSLRTDTHVAIFRTSVPTADSTARHIRLDTIIVLDRFTRKEIQRVTFSYSADANTTAMYYGTETSANNPDWGGERLNNNQLTLTGVSVFCGNLLADDDDNNLPLRYTFTYYNNPRMDLDELANPQIDYYSGDGFPGYFYESFLATAWHLKSVKLPTGGTITYSYESFDVLLDPEGKTRTDGALSHSMPPRSRLKTKTTYDPVSGKSSVWNFTYCDSAHYDPPSRPLSTSFIDSVYQGSTRLYLDRQYKVFKGCQVGHQWAQVTNPDGSWKRTYFTSSHRDNTLGSCPDSFAHTTTLYTTHIKSFAGKRGLVWKETTPTSTVINYYSYNIEGDFRDRYDYFGLFGQQANYQYIEQTSIWPRLDSTVTTRDGVSASVSYQYGQTRRESTSGTGLLMVKTERAASFNRMITYAYANQKYSGMDDLHMWSQLYSTLVTQSPSFDRHKQWMTWWKNGSYYRPAKSWLWNADSSASAAPTDTGSTSSTLCVASYSYDTEGYGNIVKIMDANGHGRTFFYGDESTPLTNSTTGLTKGLLTGIQDTVGSIVLSSSFSYDAAGRLSRSTGNNNDTIRYSYDKLGRLTQVYEPGGKRRENYAYSYLGNVSASSPNIVTASLLRSDADSTVQRIFVDGLGQQRQISTLFGGYDIVQALTVDAMGRTDTTYKPYQCVLSTAHSYDPDFAAHAATYNGIAGSYPFDFVAYLADGSGRVQYQKPPGEVFQSNGHYTSMTYAANASGSSFKQSTTDENGVRNLLYTNVLGMTDSTVTDSAGLGLKTIFSNDALGKVRSVTDPMQRVSTYGYNTRQLMTSKNTPDGNRVLYLYDKKGNLRFVKDGNHRGAINSSTKYGSYTAANSLIGYDTLTTSGRVTLLLAPLPSNVGTATLALMFNGVAVASVSSSGTTSVYLPKGVYSYGITASGGAIRGTYSITTPYSCEYVYNLYDALGRKTQTGEYLTTSATHFTQTLADSTAFPASSIVVSQTFNYDTASTDANATGQRNLRGKLSWACSYRLGTLALTSFYSYDSLGHVEWITQKGLGSGSKKFLYGYDRLGNLTKKTYRDSYDSTNNYIWWYEYDKAGRMARMYSGKDSSNRVKDVEYAYLASGRVDTMRLGTAQTVKYRYNERDWLDTLSAGKFSEYIGYNRTSGLGDAFGAVGQYNGNISWVVWSDSGVAFSSGPPSTPLGYSFGYDKANRLTSTGLRYNLTGSWYTSSAYGMPTITYDSCGNIRTLMRHGPGGVLMDNLTYNYLANTNKLDYIADQVSASMFSTDVDNQATGNYGYDGNGNVQYALKDSIAFIVYGIDNLPVTEYKLNGTVIQYVYDANGVRVAKVVGSAYTWYVPGADGRTEVLYANTLVKPTYNLWALDNIGQVKRDSTARTRFYYLKDHLGDTRVTVNATGGIDSYFDYYPYGQLLDGRSSVSSADARYKYTGKERDAETGWDCFGARYYDSRIGRFLSLDPHSSMYADTSPYCYATDNPLAVVDPSGMDTAKPAPPPPSPSPAPAPKPVVSPPPPTPAPPTQSGTASAPIVLPLPPPIQILPMIEQLGGVLLKNPITYIALMPFIFEGDRVAPQNTVTPMDQGVQPVVCHQETATEPTAGEIIAKELKGSVNQEFPEQWRGKTKAEIRKAAEQGLNGAKKAWKLLNDKRFKK